MLVVRNTLRSLVPWEKPSTNCIGGCVYLEAVLDGTEILDPTVQPLESRCTERAISVIVSSLIGK